MNHDYLTAALRGNMPPPEEPVEPAPAGRVLKTTLTAWNSPERIREREQEALRQVTTPSEAFQKEKENG